jgi:CheY-like chemotaxis protein
MAGEIVLVVDDNPINLKLARVALAVEGYDVRTAEDAEEALTMLEQVRPDLILMDLQMPTMDGLELTTHLKLDPATRDILILAVTAFAMKGDYEKALDAGCDGYMTKPIDTRTLGATVGQYLSADARRRA